jgi:hypothetical protein
LTSELAIIEEASGILLCNSHLSQDPVHCVEIQRHGPIIAAYSHQIEHALCVQVALANAQWFNINL